MASLSVHFLGTGDAFSAGGRNQSAYLIRSRNTSILLDCGATILPALKRLGLRPREICTILISHFHGDHFSGLPFLLLEGIYSDPRDGLLHIAGPRGVRRRVEELFRALYLEVADRPLPFEIIYTELQPGRSVRIGDADVEPFSVPHQADDVSLAFRVVLDGKRILYSGDSGWTEDLVAYSLGTDLFICECTYFETRVPSHLDYARLAENQGRIGSKRLILSHLGAEVLARSTDVKIELARDGFVLEL